MTKFKTVLKGVCINGQKVSPREQHPGRRGRGLPIAGPEVLSYWPSSSPVAWLGGCWSSPSPQSCPVLFVTGDRKNLVISHGQKQNPVLLYSQLAGKRKQCSRWWPCTEPHSLLFCQSASDAEHHRRQDTEGGEMGLSSNSTTHCPFSYSLTDPNIKANGNQCTG